MNPITTICGTNFSQTEVGPPAAWAGYYCRIGTLSGRDVPGKFFLSGLLGLSGMEISVNALPPGVSVPFYHRHQRHEETYIILSGHGQMQIDDTMLELVPGSVVAIKPEGERVWRNSGIDPLYYLVIQAASGSLCATGIDDGLPSQRAVSWPV